jgi:ankyrin repeat protein
MTDQLLMAARRSESTERLLFAVKNTQRDIVQVLIDSGVNVNETNEHGFAPLHESRDERITRMLVEAGAQINVRNKVGWTPLHYMLQHGLVDIACYLISKGGDPFMLNNSGKSPIDVASPKVTKNMLIAVLQGQSKVTQPPEPRFVEDIETNRLDQRNTSETLQRISAALEQHTAGMQQQNVLLSLVTKALLNQCSVLSQHPESIPGDGFQALKRLRFN